MSDANASAPTPSAESSRLYAIIVYLLYLASLPTGITAIIGVVIAYLKRDDARATPFESHYSNAIEIFWVFFACMLVVVPLCFVLIGIPLIVALYVWVIFRTVKGLVRAIDGKAY